MLNESKKKFLRSPTIYVHPPFPYILHLFFSVSFFLSHTHTHTHTCVLYRLSRMVFWNFLLVYSYYWFFYGSLNFELRFIIITIIKMAGHKVMFMVV